MRCTLCHSDQLEFVLESYRRCLVCDLVFLSSEFRLDETAEKSRYELHNNNPQDSRYRKFLRPAMDAVVSSVSPPARGLDFGCGPGPTLSKMLEEVGFQMEIYDPLFFPGDSALQVQYDFVTSTEVFEHFFEPSEELARLDRLIFPGGYLIFMTRILRQDTDFLNWHYRKDPTHVSFYSEKTLEWISKHTRFELIRVDRNVCRFQKRAVSNERVDLPSDSGGVDPR